MPRARIGQPEDSSWLEQLHSAIASSQTPESVPVDIVETVAADELSRVRECLVELERYRRSTAAGSTLDVGVGEPQNGAATDEGWTTPRYIGRFVIERPLGSGSHGLVFLAFDPVLQRQVALKVPRPEVLASVDLRRRFVREAHAAARIAHQNVVAVHEVGDSGPVSFIAWEYCHGESLAEYLRRLQALLDPTAAAALVAQIADGVQAAHEQGVLHRDLKPANVLLVANSAANAAADAPGIPKITDFGLARIDGAETAPTRTGALLGTLAYMAPEQADRQLGAVGPRADIYGLGTILYEILIGRPPFKELNEADTLRRLLIDEPIAPRRLRAGLPIDLDAVCLKCLEKRPADRYATAADVAADLRRVLSDEPTQARPLTARQRLVKWARRRPAMAGLIAVSGLAALLLLGGGSLYAVQIGRAYADSERRRIEAARASEIAEAHRQAAEASRLIAVRERDTNEGFRYAAQIRTAFAALDQGDVQAAEIALADYADGTRLAGMRGFEWYYAMRALHGEQQLLLGHQGEVYAVTWSPDGKTVASGGQDGTIRIWDSATGQSLHSIRAHESCTNDLVFTPDGRVLASVSCDRTVKLWETATWQLLATLSGEDAGEIHSADISPDGTRLATGEHGGHARIWNLSERTLQKAFLVDEPGATVHALDWSDDGRVLAIAAHTTSMWNADTWQPIAPKNIQGANSVTILPDGKRLAMAYNDRWLRVRDVRAAADDWHVMQRAPVRKLTYHATERQLLIASNGAIDILDLSTMDQLSQGDHPTNGTGMTPVGRLVGHVDRVQDVALSPDGQRVASAGFDSTVRIWNLHARNGFPLLQVPADAHGTPSLSADLTRLTVLNKPGRIVTWDVASSQELLNTPTQHPDLDFEFRGGGDIIIAHHPLPGTVYLSHRSFSNPAISQSSQFHGIMRFATSVDGRSVAFLDSNGAMRLLKWLEDSSVYERQFVISGDRHSALEAMRARLLGLSHTGRWLLTNIEHRFVIVETSTGKEHEVQSKANLDGYCFSPHERIMAGWYGDNMQICEVASGQQLHLLRSTSPVTNAAITSDEQTLAIATEDGRVSLWHIPTGQPLCTLCQLPERVFCLQFSADGQRLAAVTRQASGGTASGNAALYVWHAPVEQLANFHGPR